jgi:hypothetical protein
MNFVTIVKFWLKERLQTVNQELNLNQNNYKGFKFNDDDILMNFLTLIN